MSLSIIKNLGSAKLSPTAGGFNKASLRYLLGIPNDVFVKSSDYSNKLKNIIVKHLDYETKKIKSVSAELNTNHSTII